MEKKGGQKEDLEKECAYARVRACSTHTHTRLLGVKCIFGMLTQLVEGKYFIEDHNSTVEIDLSEAQVTTGLFTDNCMVLAEGTYCASPN